MKFMLQALPLNLNLIEILIHLLNLSILMVAVRYLLYKPIKRFMENRANEFKKQNDESDQKLADSSKLKIEYEMLISTTKQNVLQITEDASLSAKKRADEIIEEAKEKASKIIQKTEEEVELKKEEGINEIKLSIAELAYAMASEILKREITEKDLDDQINSIVKEWKND